MIWFILGVFVGYILAAIGQLGLEKNYIDAGIAKLCGKLYEIKPYVKKEWYE